MAKTVTKPVENTVTEPVAATVETQQALVTMTAAAADKVRELIEAEGDATLGLRIFVAGGGCSGMQYGMTLDEAQDGDVIHEMQGIRVLVDEMSAGYISGSEVDYVDSLMGGGFRIDNPNAVSTCGCGHSFRTSGQAAANEGDGCGHH